MKTFGEVISKSLLTLAVAGLGLVFTPGTASAEFLDFQVDEGTVPDAVDNTFTADKLNGSYSEIIVLNGDGTFDATLFVQFTAYLSDEGTVLVSSQLGPDDINANQYLLYATVTATGTFTGTGTVGDPIEFEPTSADADLFVDPDADTTNSFAGITPGDPSTLSNTTDDYLIMFASTIDQGSSFGTLVTTGLPEDQGGFYNLVFNDPTLTLDGQDYWFDLPLFGLRAINDGDFDDAVITDGTLSGDVSLVFEAVPEPTTLSLLGMGLLGASMAARRRRKAQAAAK